MYDVSGMVSLAIIVLSCYVMAWGSVIVLDCLSSVWNAKPVKSLSNTITRY